MQPRQPPREPGRGDTGGGAAWFPLTIFGIETLASAPIYARFGIEGADCGNYCADLAGLPRSAVVSLGGQATSGPPVITAFWLVAAILGYLATGAYYRTRSHRHSADRSAHPCACASVPVSAQSYVLTGLILLAGLAAPTPIPTLDVFTDLFASGLTTLITLALALFVLARAHRSRPLAYFATAFLGLAVLANLTDLGPAGTQVNAVIAGSVLLIAGATFGAADLIAHRDTT